MATHSMISLVIVAVLFAANLHLSAAQLGICLTTQGKNVPTGQELVGLIAEHNISKVRLLEVSKDILTALKGKNVEVLVGIPIPEVNPGFNAELWVSQNVKPFVPDVKIKAIVVGNEMSRNSVHNSFTFFTKGIATALVEALKKNGISDIKVTTSVDSSVMTQIGANPLPSSSKMLPESKLFLEEFFDVTKGTNSPLLVNMYPYYELVMNQGEVTPEFALFTAKSNVLSDGKLGYQNKFDAMLDSFYTVLEEMKQTDVEVVVGQTGWPTAGGVGASLENAKTYVDNLVQHMNKGTPKRPNKAIQVYVNLFDQENPGEKPGQAVPEIEKHFGLFTVDKKIKFPVAFTPFA